MENAQIRVIEKRSKRIPSHISTSPVLDLSALFLHHQHQPEPTWNPWHATEKQGHIGQTMISLKYHGSREFLFSLDEIFNILYNVLAFVLALALAPSFTGTSVSWLVLNEKSTALGERVLLCEEKLQFNTATMVNKRLKSTTLTSNY